MSVTTRATAFTNGISRADPSNIIKGAAIVLLLLLGVYHLVLNGRQRAQNAAIPHYEWDTRSAGGAKKRWMWDSLSLLREGYAKFYGKPWQVWTTEGAQVVLPPDHVAALKTLPDHTLPSSLLEFMLPEYTFKGFSPSKVEYVNMVILRDLNKNMANIFPAVRDEVGVALSTDFPTSQEWTELDPAKQILRVISRISARAFVGDELYRNEEWIDISCNYTKDVFISAMKLRVVPSWLRPLAAPLISDLYRVRKHMERARAFVEPIVRQRELDAKGAALTAKSNDTVQWLYDLLPDSDKQNYALQGALQLAITAVSVQSTSKLIVNIVLNLIQHPECAELLKEEAESVLGQCSGVWTLSSMERLEKLDSFMRESLRFEPPLTATFQRRVVQSVTLPDGNALAPGTLVLAAADAVASDPAYYPDPDKFDGLRFYSLRRSVGGSTTKNATHVQSQFVATSKTQLQFGFGRHACPGRWFASHVIKLVVARMLLEYDFRFKAGEVRPKTFLFQTTNMPHPQNRIMVRKKVE